MVVDFADKIAQLVYNTYKHKLPKTGKPQDKKEWTLLAGFVMSSEKMGMIPVSICTGTKCLGFSQLTKDGNVVFDSHAEILARRTLIRYLYQQISLVLENKTSDALLLNEDTKKFDLKPGIEFHLFISHVPCGDAAIFPKPCSKKRSLSAEEPDDVGVKRLKSEEKPASDIYRTGAKCVDPGVQDPKETGVNYHVTGVARTKPGRGNPTWSMSCSDKIALWNVCGVQGALLSLLLSKPLYLTSIVIGQSPFDKRSVERALIGRVEDVGQLPPIYKVNRPNIYLSSLPFESSRENTAPCPAAIIACNMPWLINVCVNGRKQGITKKNLHKSTSRIEVCKSVLFENFLRSHNTLKMNAGGETKSYLDYKLMAVDYQMSKEEVLKVLRGWKKKPQEFQTFTLPVDIKNISHGLSKFCPHFQND